MHNDPELTFERESATSWEPAGKVDASYILSQNTFIQATKIPWHHNDRLVEIIAGEQSISLIKGIVHSLLTASYILCVHITMTWDPWLLHIVGMQEKRMDRVAL